VLVRDRRRINALIDRYNVLVRQINARIVAVKRNGYSGVEFEKGRHARRGAARWIEVYQFEDREDLLVVLAHEFGHALGLKHGADPDSVMFPILTNAKFALSAEDLRQIKAYCSMR
jgi:predicted Zn-dependent protease